MIISEKVCVLLPAYNEARTIGSLIVRLRKKGFGVLVVDDGSSDETAAIAVQLGVDLIRHQKNLGKGVSLRDGFQHAIARGFEAVITMDADGQHNPDDIDAFLSFYRENRIPFIVGNRMGDPRRMPVIRLMTNKVMSGFISRCAGQRIDDSQCGFRFITCEVLKRMTLISKNYDIETELLLRAARNGVKIANVSVKSIYDETHKSYINPFIDTLRFFRLIKKISFERDDRG